MAQTTGELLFEDYLRSVRVTNWLYEKLFEGSNKPPDYSIPYGPTHVLLDVKDFISDGVPLGSGAYDPYAPIRAKIHKGKEKFKDLEKFCCGLVLYNVDKPLVDLVPDFVFGAMLGNIGISFPIGDFDEAKAIFGPGGKMIRYAKDKKTAIEPMNTTLGALIALGHLQVGFKRFLVMEKCREEELGRKLTWDEFHSLVESLEGTEDDISRTVLRVRVYENPYARIPFPDDLFRGPWDERYGPIGDYIGRKYAGAELVALEKLITQRGVNTRG